VIAGCAGSGNRGTPFEGATKQPPPAVRIAGPVADLAPETTTWPDTVSLATPPAASGRWDLEQCVNRALHANRGLLDAHDTREAARYSIVAASSIFQLQITPFAQANTTPGVGNDVSFSSGVQLRQLLANGTQVGLVPSISRNGDTVSTGYSFSVREPLLRGRGAEYVRANVDSARFGLRSAERALYLVENQTVLNTINAVYQVVTEREALRLNEASAARSEAHLVAARARERAGLSNSLDVFRANQQRNRANDARDSAVQAYSDALDALRVLLALPLTAQLDVAAPLALDDVEISDEDAVSIALARRVELEQADDFVTETGRVARVAQRDTLPDLDVIFTVGQAGNGDNFGDSLELGSPTLGLSVATSSNIRRIAERARYDQTRLAVDVAMRARTLRRDSIVQDVKRALREVRRGQRRIELQEEQVRQAEGKLEVARVKFQLGATGNFDVIEAEEDLRSAQIALIRGVTGTIVATHGLRASLGTLVQKPGEVLEAAPTPAAPTPAMGALP